MDMLAHMTTFVRVVDGGSLSAAARTLRLSLPAVSRQLRTLEQELGVQLVARSTRRLRVTEAGRNFYARSLRVLQDVEAARAAVSHADTVAGRLVVSASMTFGQLELLPRLRGLADRYPRLEIDLRLEDHLVDLIGEGVDIAIRAGTAPPDSTAYIAHPIAEMRRIAVAAPALVRKHGTVREPEQLVGRPCLVQVTVAGAVIHWRMQRCAAGGGPSERADADIRVPDVRGQIRSNAPLTLRDLAVAGAGIAFLPDFVVRDALASGALKRVLPKWSSPALQAVALHRAELRGVPRIRAFLEAMNEG